MDFGNPIKERAWTFQERLLSTRVLDYGTRGLSFFCRLIEVNDQANTDITDPS
jgi:hypothetical protein